MATLPDPTGAACYASDGDRFAVAGGMTAPHGRRSSKVHLLEGVNGLWKTLAVELQGLRAAQSGVLIGDLLLCAGGWDDLVGKGCCKLEGLSMLPKCLRCHCFE